MLLLVLVPAFAAGNGKGKGPGKRKADGVWCYMPDLSKVRPVLYYNSYPDDPNEPPDPAEMITRFISE